MHDKRVFIALIAAACATGLLSCSHCSIAGTETGNGTSGIVVGLTGKPAAAARVTLVPVDYDPLGSDSGLHSIRITQTDAGGRYSFSGLALGCYNLFCDSGASGAYIDSLKVSDASDDTLPTAFLRKSGSVSGSVFISSGRTPSSAFVTIPGSKLVTAVDQSDGTFHLPGLAPGTYYVEIVAQENAFFRQRAALHIVEGQADTLKNPFLLISAAVTALGSDSAGMWIGTINGLARLRDGLWRAYGLYDGLSSSRINCVYNDKGNTLWAGTSLRLARVRSDTLTENINPSGIRTITNITAVEGDSLGNVWIGTPQGLFFYDGAAVAAITGNDKSTEIGSDAPHTTLTAISAILCLHKETMVGTLHGVYFCDSSGIWREIAEMSAMAVSSIVFDSKKTVWFGTNQGVRSWDRISRAAAAPIDTRVTGAVTSLAAAENSSLYIGTADGLFLAVDSNVTKIDLGPGSVCVNALCRDREGALWVGTNDGIIRIVKGQISAIR